MINLTSRFDWLQIDGMRGKRNTITETRYRILTTQVPNPWFRWLGKLTPQSLSTHWSAINLWCGPTLLGRGWRYVLPSQTSHSEASQRSQKLHSWAKEEIGQALGINEKQRRQITDTLPNDWISNQFLLLQLYNILLPLSKTFCRKTRNPAQCSYLKRIWY